jgi:hypothetical protein
MVQAGMGSHPKFARLTDSEFRAHVVGVLSVAAIAPIRGCLLVGELEAEPADIARAAGVTVRVATSTVGKLQALGVLYRDAELGCLRVHDWDDINPKPRTDRTNAERQQKFRDRHRNGESNGVSNGDVTPRVTAQKPLCNTGEVEVEVEEGLTGSKGSRSSCLKPPAPDVENEDDRRLCRLLAEQAKDRNPKFKVKSRERWLNDMRLLRERDRTAPDDIDRAIRWVFDDDFWGGVIQSPGNLRKHFPQIWDRMTHPNRNVVPLRKENASDWLRDINATREAG